MWGDFKKFISRGSVIELAVGIIIGAALTSVVNSLVNDVIMPPISYLLGGIDFGNMFLVLKGDGSYVTLAQAKAAGAVTINYGLFINAVITFIIIAFVVFLLVRWYTRLIERPKPADPTSKECPYCFESIPIKATRCPECTSQLPAPA